ncbi:MAG: hypothetical protein M1830_005710 [Pleopsidium flavum]|nr:MAG: hypothetical protein M1830_005710 [Pleopsidium flavum]
MINDTLPLSFGVELEMVFTFHETLLQAYLNKNNNGVTIVKDINASERRHLNRPPTQYLLTRPEYLSWGLTGTAEHPGAIQSRNGQFRTYGDEPLHVAHQLLPGKTAYVHDDRKKAIRFVEWHLTNDRSLTGVDKDTLIQKLRDRIADIKAANDWDSYGIELVSRVLPISDESFTEINTLLAAINGTPTSHHGAFPSRHCGMHVHVGHPTQRFPLPTLQHLAYLLITYETQISAMHPSHRREGSEAANVDIASNRDNFLLDPARIVKKLVFDPVTRTVSRKNRWVTMQSLTEIRAVIFAKDMTLARLVNLMGGSKGHMVNFSYLLRKPGWGPATLEFRQHEGCLYGPSVKWWVLFVTGLVRLADHLANINAIHTTTGAGLVGYAFNEWHENMSFVDLFEMMDFPREGREYLGAQVAFHAVSSVVEERERERTPDSEEEAEEEDDDDDDGHDDGHGGKGKGKKRGRDDDDDDDDDGGVRPPPALRR